MLCGRREKVHVPLFLTLLAVMVVIYLGSYMVILEAHYDPKGTLTEGTADTPKEFYAVYDGNGYYNIYCDGFFIEYTDTLEFYPPDIHIYKE